MTGKIGLEIPKSLAEKSCFIIIIMDKNPLFSLDWLEYTKMGEKT